MGQIKTQEELRTAIAELERRKSIQELEMKGDFARVKESVKPINLVKNTFSQFAEIPEVRKTIISTIVGFALGYVAKKTRDVLAEESLDNMVSTLVQKQMVQAEHKNPDHFLVKAFTYFRKNLKHESPLYPFLGYKQQ